MKPETTNLTTADLAKAGATPPEPITDRPRIDLSASQSGVLEPKRVPRPSAKEEGRIERKGEEDRGEEDRREETTTREASAKATSPVAGTAAVGAGAQTLPAGAGAHAPTAGAAETTTAPLFEKKEADDLRARWNEIQVGFVDEPRTAVERADSLVAEAIKRLAESFAAGRQRLESEWGEGSEASTETLRLTLQRYRSFFNRLLSI
jgi:hypothetical protein